MSPAGFFEVSGNNFTDTAIYAKYKKCINTKLVYFLFIFFMANIFETFLTMNLLIKIWVGGHYSNRFTLTTLLKCW